MYVIWWATFIICLLSVFMVDKYSITMGGVQSSKPQIERNSHLIIELLLLTATFLLLTDNRTGVDIINYRNWYVRNEIVAGREVLYTLLRNAAHAVGMSFYMFRAIVSFVSGLIPILFLRKERQNIAFFLAIYLPSLLFLDSMQFRNQVAVCIIILGTIFLIKKDDLKQKIIFVLFVVLAMQFHTSAIMFLVFLPACSKHKKTWDKVFLVSGVLLLAVAIVNHRTVPFIDILYFRILSSADTRLYNYGSGHNIFLYPTVVHIITTILCEYSLRWWSEEEKDRVFFQYQYAQFINSANKMFFIFVPFVLMNTTFYRVLRNVFVFNIIAIGFSYTNSRNSSQRLLMFLGLLGISILWIVFAVFVYSSVEIIIDPVLKDGILFFMPE